MAFLNEIGVGDVFKEVKARLSKKVNSTYMTTELAKKVDKTSLGSKNGVAQLDASGTVPASQLPSYVDDVIEGYLNGGKFYKTQTVGTDKSVKYSDEINGEAGKIYIDKATNDNKTYRYTTAGYVPISDVPEATLKEIAQLKIDVEKLVNITWTDLNTLRDNNELVPGRQYRITDYNCTTVQEDTKSAGHQFDIIVTADSKNKLNEVARAIRHDGDENLPDATSTTANVVTTKTAYFANSKLEAWKIWYCLDNDTNRFAWADATNGKGVIYRMIDEFNNDCPYDFKNILITRYLLDTTESNIRKGGSDNPTLLDVIKDNLKNNPAFKIHSVYILNSSGDNEFLQEANNPGEYGYKDDDNPRGLEIYTGCDSNGDESYYWIEATTNSVNLYTFSNGITGNIEDSSLSKAVYKNSVKSCKFGDIAYINNVIFVVGDYCQNNILNGNCYSNSFGNNCYFNSFGNNCNSNSFGNNCNYNSFGNSCYSNSFGNNCYFNSFGNNCYSNSFGNNCYSNKFGIDSSNNKLDAYYTYNKFENGVKYVEFSGVGTNAARVQNYHIKQGMTFTGNAKHTITAKTGLNYELTVAKQSDGTVVEYCEADLLKAIQTSTITNSAKSNLD